jgi:parallel beta-helix repeat protein
VKKEFADFLATIGRPLLRRLRQGIAPTSLRTADDRLRPRHEFLEPRLLFSADLSPVALVNQTPGPILQEVQTSQAISASSVEIVVLDARVAEPEVLLADIAQQRAQGRQIVLLQLAAKDDGLDIVSAALDQARSDGFQVSAIHIISHGSDGRFDLGNRSIDESTLRSETQRFASWAQTLSDSADLLIYGCNFEASTIGQQFALNLAALTGADVAGNRQATGAQMLGGDWSLEATTGVIESSIIISEQAQSVWQHLLATGFQDVPQEVNSNTAAPSVTGTRDNLAGSSGGRTIAIDASGNHAIVWTDQVTNKIMIRLVASNGVQQGESFASSSFLGFESQPSIAMDASGNSIVVWTNINGTQTRIFAQRFDAAGSKVGSALQVSSASITATQPSVAVNDNNQVVVVWSAETSPGVTEIFGTSFKFSNLQLIMPEQRLSTNLVGVSQSRPSVAINGNRVVVTYQGADGDGLGIKARAFDIDGGNASGWVSVNSNPLGTQSAPDVAIAPDGNIVIAWQTTSAADGLNVLFKVYDQNFVTIKTDGFANTVLVNDQALPKIAMSPTGDFMIVHQSAGQSPDSQGWGVFGRVFNRNGIAPLGEISLSFVNAASQQYITGDQYAPGVAWRGGQAVSAWTSEGYLGTIPRVLTRRAIVADPALVVTPPALAARRLLEGSGNATLNVHLNSQPTADVIIQATVASNANGYISQGASLTFTPLNWYIDQPVTVYATADNVVDADSAFFVILTPTNASAPEFGGPTIAESITFTNVNIDQLHQITVDTDSDVLDGNVGSLAALFLNRGTDGLISLREAILAANATANLGAGTLPIDKINFNIAGADPNKYLRIATQLPEITDAVFIDGSSQPGGARIVLSGTAPAFAGLTLLGGADGQGQSSGSKIVSLSIELFGYHGIDVLSSHNLFQDLSLVNNAASGIHLWNAAFTNVIDNTIKNSYIAGNGAVGVLVHGADGNVIEGNNVLGNGADGILLNSANGSGAINNIVRNNTIGDNGAYGIHIYGDYTEGNQIVGNYIGFDDVYAPKANLTGGVTIANGASNNQIGGLLNGLGNIIANNKGVGVRVLSGFPGTFESINNRILGNSIYGNTSLAIDLSEFVAVNYPLPSLNEPNVSINAPELFSAFSDGPTTRVFGRIQGIASSHYRVEFFASTSPNQTAGGDGQIFLGFRNLPTNAAGTAEFDIPDLPTTAVGDVLSASVTRATDSSYSTFYGTSEISNVVTIGRQITLPENTANPIFTRNDLRNPAATGLTFSLNTTQNADAGFFTIDSVTGELNFNGIQDFEAMLLDASAGNDHSRAAFVHVTDGVNGTYSDDLTYIFNFTDVNDAPTVAMPPARSVPEDTVVTFVGANRIEIKDQDSQSNLAQGAVTAKVQVQAFSSLGQPLAGLSLDGVTYAAVLNFEASISEINALLLNLTFKPAANSTDPARLVVSVDDNGSGFGNSLVGSASATLAFTAVNDFPVIAIALPDQSVNYTENALTVALFPTAVFSDADGTALTQMRISTQPAFVSADDILGYTPLAGVTYSNPSVGTYLFTGTASIAQYQSLLRSITFASLSNNPSNLTRVFQVEVFDGTDWSVPAQVNLAIQPVNDAPTFKFGTAIEQDVAFNGVVNVGNTSTPTLLLGDLDAGAASLQVTINVSNGRLSLPFSAADVILNSPDNGSFERFGSFVLQGNVARLQSVINQLVFIAETGFSGDASIAFWVSDLGNTGLGGSKTAINSITLHVAMPIAPVVNLQLGAMTYVENSIPAMLFTGVEIGLTSSPLLTQAKVQQVSGFSASQDVIYWNPALVLPLWTVSGFDANGVLLITGTGTKAEYEALLGSFTYSNSSDNPSTAPRQLQLQVFDQYEWSVPASVGVNVQAVNDAPILAVLSQSGSEDAVLALSGARLNVADVDSNQLVLTVEVSNGTLNWASGAVQPAGVQTTASNLLTLSGTAAEINAWATSLAFTPNANFNGVANVQWRIIDGGVDPFAGNSFGVNPLATSQSSTITVAAVNDAPTWQGLPLLAVEQGAAVAVTTRQTAASDVDDAADQLGYELASLPQHGQLLLNGQVLNATSRFTQNDVDQGRVTYRHDNLADASDRFSFTVADAANVKTGLQTMEVSITARQVVVIAPTGTTVTPTPITATSTTATPANAAVTDIKAVTASTGNSSGDASNSLGAAVATAVTNPTVASTAQRAASKAGPSAAEPATAALATETSINTGVGRTTETGRFAQDKALAQASAQASTPNLFGEGVKLDGLGGFITRVKSQAELTEYTEVARATLKDKLFADEVRKVRDEVTQTIKWDRNVVASTTAVSASLSIGYVIWLVRGGALLSSLLASIPAWRMMDPLPILGSMGGEDEGEDGQTDDDSLDAMIDRSKAERLQRAESLAANQQNPPNSRIDLALNPL